MSISTLAQWEIRPANGGANNGGGFKAGATGTDRSQQDAAHVVIDGTTITCLVHTTTTQLNVTGGSGLMSPALRAYLDLERARPDAVDDVAADRVLDAMDDAWYALSDDERAALDRRL